MIQSSTAKISRTAWLPIIAAVAAYCGGVVLHPLDHYLVSLLPSGSIPNPQVASSAFATVLQGSLLAAIALCAYFVSVRGSRQREILGLAFDALASAVIQFSLWDSMKIEPVPGATVLALGLGVALARVGRVFEKDRVRAESKHYELLLQNEELQDARLQIVKQDEVDRRNLAADLHDQVLNDLKVIKQKVNSLSETPDANSVSELDELITRAIESVREVMDSLSPSVLEHLGLAAAVEDYMRRNSARGGFRVRFQNNVHDDEMKKLSRVQLSLLYRICQEAVNNISKHANAKFVKGSLDIVRGRLRVVIADDGVGIDADSVQRDTRGLRFMRQRADLMGATIAWLPGKEGKGTQLEIDLELPGEAHAQNSHH